MKQLRGKDYRLAFKAIAELRNSSERSLASIVSGYKAKDEQRAFQYLVARIVLEKGVGGLAEKWHELPSPEWRENLMSEIRQFLDLWAEESLIDLLINALNDADLRVCRRGVTALRECLEELSVKEEREARKTESGQRFLAGKERLQSWVTPQRRARIAQTVTRALEQHSENPWALTWPSWYIELLGYTANKTDESAIAVLSGLRRFAGEPYKVSYQRLDPSNLPWPEKLLSERKGVIPTLRIAHHPTGLLDISVLDTALKRISDREP
ncbi:MAG: hypothetical protein HYV04_15860 [Deltaproteobacteria bacterium]|nr:hypothetical protein [Deltaproteobacteria bacterium]